MQRAGWGPSLAFGLFLILLGGSALFLSVHVLATSYPLTVLECSRRTGTCRLTDSNPLETRSRELALGDVQGVDMRVWAAGRRGAQYQIVLKLRGQEIEVGDAAFGEEAHWGLMNQIKTFLRTPSQDGLTIRRDGRWQVYGASGLGLVVGLLMTALGIRLLPIWGSRGRG